MKRLRKTDRTTRRQAKVQSKPPRSQATDAIGSPVNGEVDTSYVASSQNTFQASGPAIDSSHDNRRQRIVDPPRTSSIGLPLQSAPSSIASSRTNKALSPQPASFPTADSSPPHTTNTQRRGPDATTPNVLGETLHNDRRYTSLYSFTGSISSTGDDVAEPVAIGSVDQDEAQSTASAAEDPELENDGEFLRNRLQHGVMILRVWTTRLASKDALSTFSESILWILTQPISWFLASLSYISRCLLRKTALLWMLAVLVGLVAVAVYGRFASVHAGVDSVPHIGPWSICKASRGTFFRTACHLKEITADVINTFNETYATFDTAMATRNIISTAPRDLRSSRDSLLRDLVYLRALNATLNVPIDNFAMIVTHIVNVHKQSSAIPDVLMRYLTTLAATMSVVEHQTSVTIAETAAFRAGKTLPYTSSPGKRPRRVIPEQVLSIRLADHVRSWQKVMEPLLGVGKYLLEAITACIDPVQALEVSLETAINATHDSQSTVHSKWRLPKWSLYWFTRKEAPETQALLQTLSVTREMKGTLHHLSTWFGPMCANIISVNLGLEEMLRAFDGGGVLVLGEGEGLELLNQIVVVFNKASARMVEGRRALEATQMTEDSREETWSF